MAMRPTRPVCLTRGQPIARIVLLSRDSLQGRLEEREIADVDAEGGS